jgi:hypothetical protein
MPPVMTDDEYWSTASDGPPPHNQSNDETVIQSVNPHLKRLSASARRRRPTASDGPPLYGPTRETDGGMPAAMELTDGCVPPDVSTRLVVVRGSRMASDGPPLHREAKATDGVIPAVAWSTDGRMPAATCDFLL